MNPLDPTTQEITQEEVIRRVEKGVVKDTEILAAIFFGSFPQEGFSDIDVCIVLYPGKYKNLYLSEKKLNLMMALGDFDIHIFQQLPMYIRIRVLKGKIIFCRDEKLLYEIAIQTIKEFEDYRKIYDEYLRGVARG
ncbi:MAG: nucleotidyltransferase domain-containing protein [Candidatus Methanofastidiosia archaeon]